MKEAREFVGWLKGLTKPHQVDDETAIGREDVRCAVCGHIIVLPTLVIKGVARPSGYALVHRDDGTHLPEKGVAA